MTAVFRPFWHGCGTDAGVRDGCQLTAPPLRPGEPLSQRHRCGRMPYALLRVGTLQWNHLSVRGLPMASGGADGAAGSKDDGTSSPRRLPARGIPPDPIPSTEDASPRRLPARGIPPDPIPSTEDASPRRLPARGIPPDPIPSTEDASPRRLPARGIPPDPIPSTEDASPRRLPARGKPPDPNPGEVRTSGKPGKPAKEHRGRPGRGSREDDDL